MDKVTVVPIPPEILVEQNNKILMGNQVLIEKLSMPPLVFRPDVKND